VSPYSACNQQNTGPDSEDYSRAAYQLLLRKVATHEVTLRYMQGEMQALQSKAALASAGVADSSWQAYRRGEDELDRLIGEYSTRISPSIPAVF
jgi:hypothetical protein